MVRTFGGQGNQEIPDIEKYSCWRQRSAVPPAPTLTESAVRADTGDWRELRILRWRVGGLSFSTMPLVFGNLFRGCCQFPLDPVRKQLPGQRAMPPRQIAYRPGAANNHPLVMRLTTRDLQKAGQWFDMP